MSNESSGQKQLSVLLKLNDQLSGGLNKTITSLRKFGAESKKALQDYEALRRGLAKPINTSSLDKLGSKYRSVTKDLRAFTREQGKVGTRFSQPVDTKGLDAQLQKLREYRKELRATAKEANGLRTAVRGGTTAGAPPVNNLPGTRTRRPPQRRGFFNAMERTDDFLQTTQQIAYAWRARADSLRPYVDETLRLNRAQEKFKAIGLSDADNTRAFEAVRKNVEQIKGVSLTDATESVTDLHTALGDLNHAIESLPIASKYRFAFSTLFGDKFSPDEIEEQLRSAFKYLEMTGKVAKGREEMERSFNVMVQMGAATGGRVSPTEMLSMARRGGPSLQGLTPEGLRNMSAPIQELGGEGAGTAMMSLYQALVGGVMKNSAKEEFQRLGLVDTSKIQTGKHSDIIKKVLPGWNQLAPLMQEDPLKAADRLLEAMRSKGVDTGNANKVREELAILFQNRTAQRMMSILTTQRSQVKKESGLAAGAKDVEGLYKQANNGPLGAIQRYEKAMENFRATMGQAILPLLTQFAEYASPIANFFQQHPTLTKYAMALLLIGKAGSGLVQTFALLNASHTLEFFSRAKSEADGLSGAMGNTEKRALGLKGRLETLPTMVKIGLVLGAAWYTLQNILEAVQAYKDWQTSEQAVKQNSVAFYSGHQKLKDAYAQTGEQMPDERYTQQFPNTWAVVNRQRSLEYLLTPGRVSQSEGFYSRFELGDYFNTLRQGKASQTLKERAPELNEGRFMQLFEQKLKTLDIQLLEPDRAGLFRSLEATFPKGYKEASEMNAQAAIAELIGFAQRLRDMSNTAQQVPPAFTQATGAARTFAINIGNIKIPGLGIVAAGVDANNNAQNQATPTAPKSAIGSIVQRNGLIYGHRGNVIFPANLSRRSPGDWLASASAVAEAAQQSQTLSGGGINVGGISITVQAHPSATRDPQALATEIAAKLKESFADHLWANQREIERITAMRVADGRARA